MKTSIVLLTGILSFPLLDYAASGFDYSFPDTADAFWARRSAYVVRGPYGGVAVGARRTAYGFGRRPGLGFLAAETPLNKGHAESEAAAPYRETLDLNSETTNNDPIE